MLAHCLCRGRDGRESRNERIKTQRRSLIWTKGTVQSLRRLKKTINPPEVQGKLRRSTVHSSRGNSSVGQVEKETRKAAEVGAAKGQTESA